MTVKDRFTEQEWHDLIRAPMLASFAITAADPGGLWSTVREASATAGALRDARGEESLAGEIVAEYETSDGRGIARDGVTDLIRDRSPGDATDEAVAVLGRIAESVERRAPEQMADFRNWIRETARRVAEAGTEGGFLGLGGERVSERERQALADIDAVLDQSDTPLDDGPIPV